MAKLYPELSTPVVSSPYKRSPFKHIDISRHEFNTKNLKLPSTPFPRGNIDPPQSLGSSSRIKSALRNNAPGLSGTREDTGNRLFSPIRTPAAAPTIRERASRIRTGMANSSSASQSQYRKESQLNTPRSALRPTQPANTDSTSRKTLERQFKTIISTLDSSTSAKDRTHKRTFSSLQLSAASPSQRFKSTSRNRLRDYQNSLSHEHNVPTKRRKVVTFQDERGNEDVESEDSDIEISEEEALLETKQASRIKRKLTSETTGTFDEASSSSASVLLELECEIKQIQLDNLRKFKELQQQMQVQAKQIQELQEENKTLRAALKSHRLR